MSLSILTLSSLCALAIGLKDNGKGPIEGVLPTVLGFFLIAICINFISTGTLASLTLGLLAYSLFRFTCGKRKHYQSNRHI